MRTISGKTIVLLLVLAVCYRQEALAQGTALTVNTNRDGGSNQGLRLWDNNNKNWSIYVGSAGAGKSYSGGSAVAGHNFSGIAMRFRVDWDLSKKYGFIFENSAEKRLFSIDAAYGNANFAGNVKIEGGLETAGGAQSIVLYRAAPLDENNLTNYHGFATNNNGLAYHVSRTSDDHIFYASKADNVTSKELFRIEGSGWARIPDGGLVFGGSTEKGTGTSMIFTNSIVGPDALNISGKGTSYYDAKINIFAGGGMVCKGTVLIDASTPYNLAGNSPLDKISKDIKANYSLLVGKGVLAEDYALAPKDLWADYVFGKDYQRRPLPEVASYITTNGHLPGIPSEKEVGIKGYNLHNMNAKFLEKIEELTLYAIDQQKEIETLKQQLAQYKQLAQKVEQLMKAGSRP